MNQREKVTALKMEAIRSSETSVYTRSTRRYISEDGTVHSHRHENLKSYKFKVVWKSNPAGTSSMVSTMKLAIIFIILNVF
jgi:hypothetical protein